LVMYKQQQYLQSTRTQKANTMISTEGSERTDPKATKSAKATQSHTKRNKAQPTERHCTDYRTLNQGKECAPQATPARLPPQGLRLQSAARAVSGELYCKGKNSVVIPLAKAQGDNEKFKINEPNDQKETRGNTDAEERRQR
jgi:hypothetical protein